MQSEIEKIGLVEWFDVRKHSRRLYVLLDPKDVSMHDIQEGDRIRIKLEMLVKGAREEEEVTSPDIRLPDLNLVGMATPAPKGLTQTELRVLEFIGGGEKNAMDIMEVTKLSREHSARLLKNLYERGFLTRDATTAPYRYRVKEGKR